jgi:hypothetical protein
VSPLTQSVPASGGSFQFTVTTSANCQWTATPADAWVAITPTSGSGSTTVSYSVGPNPTTAARTSSIQVAGQTLSISQAAASCSFALDTTSQAVPAGGGNYRVTVKTMAGCGWTASSNAGWLVVTAGSKGSGPGTVSYTVRGNTSQVPRVGTLTIGNQTVTVTQAGAGTIP